MPAVTEPYAFFVGEVALDEYYAVPEWPGIGTKVNVQIGEPEMGGTIANAASVYAGYGNATRFCYTLNTGAVSDRLLADLESGGVDTASVRRDPSVPDSRTLIFLAHDEHTVFVPERTFARLELSASAVAALHGAAYVYTTLTDARMLAGGERSGLELLAAARANGARVVYDLDVGATRPGDDAYLGQADVVFVNAEGVANLGRAEGRSEDVVVRDLLGGGAELVVVTRAAAGCTVFTESAALDVAGVPVDVVDVTGAGDTFCSSFLHGLGAGADLADVARFANAAAARSVTRHGPRAGVATSAEVHAFAAHHGVDLAPTL